MKKILFILSLLLIFYSCKTQNKKTQQTVKNLASITVLKIKPNSFIPKLPDKTNESSGIIYFDHLFWTFNDSGGKNEIYGINSKGEIVRTVEIKNAKNIDWEDIAQDKKHIYIGDFGNNNGVRNNQKIYVVKKKKLDESKKQKVDASEIRFSYKNQEDFHFKPKTTPFDCEALTEFKGNLYLFTKDWTNETTTVYKVSEKKGEYSLAPREKIDVGCLVTGADISPDKQKLALVGHHDYKPVVWLFSDISEENFLSGKITCIELDNIYDAQTEGICFKGNDTLLISCERTSAFDQQIFYIDLTKQ
ncbi:MAG TPA: hypothetical protein VKA38_08680 [Draconibacterium sp.]|nr:hypothetical protein [Draconibacterium sp.]